MGTSLASMMGHVGGSYWRVDWHRVGIGGTVLWSARQDVFLLRARALAPQQLIPTDTSKMSFSFGGESGMLICSRLEDFTMNTCN